MGWTQKASKGGDGNFEKAPAGNHPAVLVALIDMGTQTVDGFQGGPSKEQHRAYMVWELVSEPDSNGKNFLIGMDLNISLNEKATLRKWIEARTGKPIPEGSEYDISKELGQPCLLSVVEKNGYPKIMGMSGVPKGTAVPKPTKALTTWTLDDYGSAGKIDLPDWLPWLFGECIEDHIMRCGEIANGDVKPGSVNTSPNAGTTKTASKGAPPRKPGNAPPPNAAKFWLALSDAAEPELLTVSEIKHQFETVQGVDWAQNVVCLDGSESWLPLFTLIPESKSWSPF